MSSPSSASSALDRLDHRRLAPAPSKLIMSAAAFTPPSFAVLIVVASFVCRSTMRVELLQRGLGHLVETRDAHRDVGLLRARRSSLSTSAACWLGRCARIVATICGCSFLIDLRDGARLHPLQRVDARRLAALEDPAEQRARAALAERIRHAPCADSRPCRCRSASSPARRRAARRARRSRARAARRQAPPSRSRASAPLRRPCAAAPTPRSAHRDVISRIAARSVPLILRCFSHCLQPPNCELLVPLAADLVPRRCERRPCGRRSPSAGPSRGRRP